MAWTTLYVTGIGEYHDPLVERLDSLDGIMPGYTQTDEGAELFWMDESLGISAIKAHVGARLIWKYRLRFYTRLDEFRESAAA